MYRLGYQMAVAIIAGILLSGCASYEKRVNLIYEPTLSFKGGDGEIYVAGPLMDARLTKLPGGRVVLGAVQNSVTRIVTAEDVSKWVGSAVGEELYHAGYRVHRAPSLSKVPKGVLMRVVSLSGSQYSNGLFLNTCIEIGLSADIWRDGRLIKTLSATAGSQEQGIDRSGAAVSSALSGTLRSVLQQLVPDIIRDLEN